MNNKFKWAFIISNNHFFAFISHFVIQQDSSAKQAFIAKEIKKSERTVKSITARLTEKGIIKRSKGKGSDWAIIYD